MINSVSAFISPQCRVRYEFFKGLLRIRKAQVLIFIKQMEMIGGERNIFFYIVRHEEISKSSGYYRVEKVIP